MRIDKVHLKNIRSHKDNEIIFNDGINVISGRTGSGKSSILMAIEYALFGSSAFPNSTIMRRNSKTAKIELDFKKDNHKYEVIRGLKRSGRGITVDIDNMKVYIDGKQLNLLGRKNDIDVAVKRILGYPDDVKGKELFEITTYTRQDEIRKIIEMKPEERQEYIDRILQLAKYKLTADNLKGILRYFESEIKSKKELIKFNEGIEEEIAKLEESLANIEKRIAENENKIEDANKKYEIISSAVSKLESEYNVEIQRKIKKNRLGGELNSIKKEIEDIEKEIAILNSKITDEIKEPKLNESQIKLAQLQQIKKATEDEIKKIEKELNKVEKLEGGICPICKQEVGKEHVDKIRLEYNKQTKQLNLELNRINAEIKETQNKIENQKKEKERYDEIQRIKISIKEKENRLNKLNSRKEEIIELYNKITLGNIDELEKKLKEKREKKEKILGELNSIKKELVMLKKMKEDSERELKHKRRIAEQLEKERGNIEKIEKLIDLLTRLREDIKNMREIVRKNYLEEFRKIFRKRFEEIRRDETEYSVDVKSDYEPIAYANGVEEKIQNLSGGEKTSVALAYKLALSELASMASAVIPTQLLILDEPTTGLDSEDVKALAEAIKNISHIPQVIIVTHDEALKNYADHIINIEKINGESVVTQ